MKRIVFAVMVMMVLTMVAAAGAVDDGTHPGNNEDPATTAPHFPVQVVQYDGPGDVIILLPSCDAACAVKARLALWALLQELGRQVQ